LTVDKIRQHSVNQNSWLRQCSQITYTIVFYCRRVPQCRNTCGLLMLWRIFLLGDADQEETVGMHLHQSLGDSATANLPFICRRTHALSRGRAISRRRRRSTAARRLRCGAGFRRSGSRGKEVQVGPSAGGQRCVPRRRIDARRPPPPRCIMSAGHAANFQLSYLVSSEAARRGHRSVVVVVVVVNA